MCILFFAFDIQQTKSSHKNDLTSLGISHPFRLLLANNRDEFLQRPTSRVDWWNGFHENVMAPQDLDPKGEGDHGTWLGITKDGKFSILTNYREDPSTWTKDALSRGFLVRDFLLGDVEPRDFVEKVAKVGNRYNGFNLICGQLSQESSVWYIGNREDVKPMALKPNRVYGLSNGTLISTEWPKVSHGIHIFKEALAREIGTMEQPGSPPYTENPLVDKLDTPHAQLIATLLDDVLSDKTTFPHHDKHVGSTWNPSLAHGCQSVCVPLGKFRTDYGTRTQSVIIVDKDSWCDYVERELFRDTIPGDTRVGLNDPVHWKHRWIPIEDDVVHQRFKMTI